MVIHLFMQFLLLVIQYRRLDISSLAHLQFSYHPICLEYTWQVRRQE